MVFLSLVRFSTPTRTIIRHVQAAQGLGATNPSVRLVSTAHPVQALETAFLLEHSRALMSSVREADVTLESRLACELCSIRPDQYRVLSFCALFSSGRQQSPLDYRRGFWTNCLCIFNSSFRQGFLHLRWDGATAHDLCAAFRVDFCVKSDLISQRRPLARSEPINVAIEVSFSLQLRLALFLSASDLQL